MLIENGAFSDVINLNSETPLHLAAKSGSVECMKILIENGASLQARDKIGKTCLDKAIESYKKNACLTLLENKRFGIYSQFSFNFDDNMTSFCDLIFQGQVKS